jgi:hypothetical protein
MSIATRLAEAEKSLRNSVIFFSKDNNNNENFEKALDLGKFLVQMNQVLLAEARLMFSSQRADFGGADLMVLLSHYADVVNKFISKDQFLIQKNNETQGLRMLDLSGDLLDYVFSFCDVTTAASHLLVSKKFHKLLEKKLWSHVYLQHSRQKVCLSFCDDISSHVYDHDSPARLSQQVSSFDWSKAHLIQTMRVQLRPSSETLLLFHSLPDLLNVRVLWLDFYSIRDRASAQLLVVLLLLRCRFLEEVRFEMEGRDLSEVVSPSVLEDLRRLKLKRLRLESDDSTPVEGLLKSSELLESLYIFSSDFGRFVDFSELQCSNLKKLSLFDISSTASDMQAIISRLDKCEFLELSLSIADGNLDFDSLLSSPLRNSLEVLSLQFKERWWSLSSKQEIGKFLKLKKLTVKNMRGHFDFWELMRECTQSAPELQFLEVTSGLSGSASITGDLVHQNFAKNIAHLPYLMHFNFISHPVKVSVEFNSENLQFSFAELVLKKFPAIRVFLSSFLVSSPYPDPSLPHHLPLELRIARFNRNASQILKFH